MFENMDEVVARFFNEGFYIRNGEDEGHKSELPEGFTWGEDLDWNNEEQVKMLMEAPE